MEAVVERVARARGDEPVRLAVEAVPGAGKTYLLRSLARLSRGTCLLLAYNAQLAREIRDALPEADCVTFHSLCGRCLAPARDDAQLDEAVRRAEEGSLLPRLVPKPDTLLVDEAQDVRPLYARLLRVLGLVQEARVVVVAGDRNQLVYDFDLDFPASLDTLLSPERTFLGKWERVHAVESRRLPAPIANFVNRIFGTDIVGMGGEGKQVPVEVRVAKSMFDLRSTLSDLFSDLLASPLLLLVDRKRGNRPLRSLLNSLSRGGTSVSVHGEDESSPSSSTTVRCATYWTAKGLQADTVVVLLPGRAPRNPTYVALTRATRRLVVVVDPRDPHGEACRSAMEGGGEVVLKGASSSLLLRATEEGEREGREAARFVPSGWPCLDGRVPRRGLVRAHARWGEWKGGEAEKEEEDALPSFLGEAVVRMCLVHCETRATGKVRGMEDVLHPSRLDYASQSDAIRAGFVGRSVPPSVPEDSLLAPDLRSLAAEAYRSLLLAEREGDDESRLDALAVVSLALEAWDGFDHAMRQRLPVSAWARRGEVRDAIGWLRKAVPSLFSLSSLSPRAEYDVRLVGEQGHVRVHATDEERCYHLSWGVSSADEARACVRAAMHPRGVCRLVDVGGRRLADVTLASEASRLALCEREEG